MGVTQKDADRLIEKIRPHGLEIGKLSQEDSLLGQICKNIMFWYNAWHKCPGDPGSYVVCESYLDQYLARKI